MCCHEAAIATTDFPASPWCKVSASLKVAAYTIHSSDQNSIIEQYQVHVRISYIIVRFVRYFEPRAIQMPRLANFENHSPRLLNLCSPKCIPKSSHGSWCWAFWSYHLPIKRYKDNGHSKVRSRRQPGRCRKDFRTLGTSRSRDGDPRVEHNKRRI